MHVANGQDDPIGELLASKQFKQAINLCDKKLKKTPDSDSLKVRRIGILLLWPERYSQGIRELESLLDRNPPVSDIDVLNIIDAYEGSRNGELGSKLGKIWQRAASSRPKDEQLYSAWYQMKFEKGDLRGAQQACVAWMKNLPQNRNPYFLNILMNYLISQDQRATEQERKLAKTLAYNFISKAAQEGISGKVSNNARALTTLEDVLLFARISRAEQMNGHASTTLRQIRNHLHVGKSSWEIARQMIELIEMDQSWVDLWEFCRAVLNESRDMSGTESLEYWGKMGDDWKAWEGILEATDRIATEQISKSTEDLIDSFNEGGKRSRNARFALLKLFTNECQAGRKDRSQLITVIWEYFEDYSDKVTCFQDLKPYLGFLDRSEQKELLSHTSETSRTRYPKMESSNSKKIRFLTTEVNELKLEYHLIISRGDLSKIDTLPTFIRLCLSLYRESLTYGLQYPASDRLPGDDAALLAAMALIRQYREGHWIALIQSIIVLEHLLLHSKHNYDALLILVRLYMFLGAGSLALDRYSRLSIKNLQHTTVSWILYTCISTIHPHPATAMAPDGRARICIDPLDDIVQALNWHDSAQGLCRRAVNKMQSNGQWNMSIDALDTSQKLSRGFARYMLTAEANRITHFRSRTALAKEKDQGQIILPVNMDDPRDRTAFPDYEAHGQPSFEELLPRVGPSVRENERWLAQQFEVVRFWDLLYYNGESRIQEEALQAITESHRGDPECLTPSDLGAGNLINVLRHLWEVYSIDSSQYDRKAVHRFVVQFVECLENWMSRTSISLTYSINENISLPVGLSPDLYIPTWTVYHQMYSTLEVCQIMKMGIPRIITENSKKAFVEQSWLTERLGIVSGLALNMVKDIERSAIELREQLRRPTTLSELVAVVSGSSDSDSEDLIGGVIRNLGERSETTKICKDLQESWIEAFDGVLHTKIG